MMKDAMGLIYAAEDDVELRDLTLKRSIAAVPFGGRYRLIDFPLSNMINSGIRNIGVITQSNYGSLLDHIGTGKEWDLNRRRDGLFILSPFANHNNPGWYKGTVDAIRSVMGYVRKSLQKYVIITGSHMLCNMTYNDALQFHVDTGADITVIYKEDMEIPEEKLRKYTILQTDDKGRILDLEVNPTVPKSRKISMKMYIMDKSLLDYLIEECVAKGNNDFVKDILQKKLDKLKIYGYPFDGYLARIDTITTYYRNNMELLNAAVRDELFNSAEPIYTKIKSEVPVKYSETAKAENCLVADGCVIEGEVENCILFRGVKIYKGARVRNSIIMQDSEILENAVLDHVILDKDVLVRKGKMLIGQENYPVVISKGAVI